MVNIIPKQAQLHLRHVSVARLAFIVAMGRPRVLNVHKVRTIRILSQILVCHVKMDIPVLPGLQSAKIASSVLLAITDSLAKIAAPHAVYIHPTLPNIE